MRTHALPLLASMAAACGGSDAPHHNLFPPKPECTGDPVVVLMGSHPQVISHLAIGSAEDGFDLDGDGKPDNKLSAVAMIAQSAIDDSFKNDSIVIPMEFFDMPTIAEDTCVKFAVYLGAYAVDKDGDTKKSFVPGGDCNDNDPNVHPGATEIVGNFKDDNCDGKADEDPVTHAPSTDTMDRDGDGFSMAQGDCDDNDNTVYPGAPEICGDGKDNDCDGEADRSHDAAGNTIACSPFDGMHPVAMPLDPLSLNMGQPVISFKDGTITNEGGVLKLTAGPDFFAVTIPVRDGIVLELKITGATITGDLVPMGDSFVIKNGKLGGVLDAKTMDTIRGLDISQIGLKPEDSLLDATFGGGALLGTLLNLPVAPKGFKYKGCRSPDIDVDGDGPEYFCDSNPDDDVKTVDICIDGDGTEVRDEVDGSGMVTKHCTEAVDSKGNPRFVDGVSVELNLETVPLAKLQLTQ
jgi:Putative metal-binding motif